MAVFNIRGTNGSGKTHIVRSLIEEYGDIPILNDKGKIEAHLLKNKNTRQKVYCLGSYRLSRGGYTGGVDGVHSSDELVELVKKYNQYGSVIFEGIIVSTVFERWKILSYKLGNFVFVYLDTPLDVCLQRIYARTKRKTIQERQVADKYKYILNSRQKFIDADCRVRVLEYENSYDQFVSVMHQSGVYL